MPEGFASDVLAQAGVRSPQRRAGRWLVLPRPAVFAAAAAVLLVGLGVGLWAARGLRPGVPAEPTTAAEVVPVEYLEEVDVLLALSEDEFQAYLLADLEEPWGDGS